MTGFTGCVAEAGLSSFFVAAALAEAVNELQKPAHRNASVKTFFSIEVFLSSWDSRENAERGRFHQGDSRSALPLRITEKCKFYSKVLFELLVTQVAKRNF
jgi:hypothetical protein